MHQLYHHPLLSLLQEGNIEDSIDAIPSATAPIDEFNCCDVCKRKDEKFKYAQMYCVVCAKKLCDSHLKVRNALYCWIDTVLVQLIIIDFIKKLPFSIS